MGKKHYLCPTKRLDGLKIKYIFLLAFLVCILFSCSSTKFVPDSHYLLESVKIKSDDKTVDVSTLEPYIRQKANSKWFSLFKIPMGTYALSGLDSTKWINRTLRNIGEKPVYLIVCKRNNRYLPCVRLYRIWDICTQMSS